MALFRDVKDVKRSIHREIQTISSLPSFSRKLFSSPNFIRILPILIEASLFAFFLFSLSKLWSKRMMLLEYESVLSAC